MQTTMAADAIVQQRNATTAAAKTQLHHQPVHSDDPAAVCTGSARAGPTMLIATVHRPIRNNQVSAWLSHAIGCTQFQRALPNKQRCRTRTAHSVSTVWCILV